MDISLSQTFYYKIKKGDTIEGLSSNFNTDKSKILRNNSQIDLYPGEWIVITQNEYITHIVKPCETLNLLSSKYNVEVEKIKKDNSLQSDKLFIGQRIKIFKT